MLCLLTVRTQGRARPLPPFQRARTKGGRFHFASGPLVLRKRDYIPTCRAVVGDPELGWREQRETHQEEHGRILRGIPASPFPKKATAGQLIEGNCPESPTVNAKVFSLGMIWAMMGRKSLSMQALKPHTGYAIHCTGQQDGRF